MEKFYEAAFLTEAGFERAEDAFEVTTARLRLTTEV